MATSVFELEIEEAIGKYTYVSLKRASILAAFFVSTEHDTRMPQNETPRYSSAHTID